MKKFLLFIISFLILIISVSSYIVFTQKVSVENYYIENDKIIVVLNDKRVKNCYIGNNFESNWRNVDDGKCIFEYTDNHNYIYYTDLLNRIKKIEISNDIYEVKDFSINKNQYYLAINGKEKILYNLEIIGKTDKKINYSIDDNNIIKIENDYIIGLKKGNANINISFDNINYNINVIVTDLIDVMPYYYNLNRKFISCNKYSKEDNDLLDSILKDRVTTAGMNTRAGAVAAARFLMLEFKNRMDYFAENGRLSYEGNMKIDGEGRYYHEGLYLNSSRFENISKSMYGPTPWGCTLYTYVEHKYANNGFDCSGFITWILKNAGFDPGDIGSGITKLYDMTDIAEKIKLTTAIENNTLRVGDLLSGTYSTGGHIAMLVGIDDNNYYVAESIGMGISNIKNEYGPIIKTYKKENLKYNFYWQIDMDNFYKEDGNYTEHWSLL